VITSNKKEVARKLLKFTHPPSQNELLALRAMHSEYVSIPGWRFRQKAGNSSKGILLLYCIHRCSRSPFRDNACVLDTDDCCVYIREVHGGNQ